VILSVVLAVIGAAGAGVWSHRVLTDRDLYATSVAPLCGHRWTTRLTRTIVRRRLRRTVGTPMATRLGPIADRVLGASASWPATRGWVVANRLAHRHRRRLRMKSVPQWTVAPAMVTLATAGRVVAGADRLGRWIRADDATA